MTFISITYGLFLLIILALYWLGRQETWRLWVMLVASLVFYSSLQIAYIPLLAIATLLTFTLGRWLDPQQSARAYGQRTELSNEAWESAQTDWNQRRLGILILGVGLNVVLLLGFKYIPFGLDTAGAILGRPEWQALAERIGRTLVAPLGISFFSFECIAYLIDVYRGAPATGSLLRFATYKFFFPKFVSGPITRYHTLAPQWRQLALPRIESWVEGLWWIARGAVKKGILADQLGVMLKLGLDDSLFRAGSGDLWLLTVAYGLQLYLDFSGYVDMARGTAALFGLHLPDNFNAPYLSTSIADFWRRWHMTLGDWLRNYLYFPLGGSRVGLARTCLNLFLVMAIAGIWHGSAWGFVVWGCIHGGALVVHRLVDQGCKMSGWASFWGQWPGMILAWGLTQGLVFGSWIFFRLPDVNHSWWVVTHLVGQRADTQFAANVYGSALGLGRPEAIAFVGAIALGMGLWYGLGRLTKIQLNWPVKLGLVPILLYAVWQLAPEGALPYIYFNF